MTWEDAKKNCVSKSMQLFEPRTSDVNSAVYKDFVSLSGTNDYVWLGITDFFDGKYRYESDKQEVDDGMWASDQRFNDHCVEFGGWKFRSAEWQDHKCSFATHSICEEI